jgi:hypothetical protein
MRLADTVADEISSCLSLINALALIAAAFSQIYRLDFGHFGAPS